MRMIFYLTYEFFKNIMKKLSRLSSSQSRIIHQLNHWQVYLIILSTIFFMGCAQPIKNDFQHQNLKSANQTIFRKYGAQIKARFLHKFEAQHIHFPAHYLALIGLKYEQKLEVWAKNKLGPWKKITTYPLTATSGTIGPKLFENDEQIPEGLYKVTWLNPLSQLHLSLKLNYPNSFDRYYARLDKRVRLGGNIFIHGKSTSVGCLAIGDVAIEELYWMVAKTGLTHTEVILAPQDLRIKMNPKQIDAIWWYPQRIQQIKKALQRFNTAVLSERISR